MSSTVNSQRLDSSSVAGGQASSVRITEIDVSRPSRALAVLRLSDLVLVLGCGFGALGVLPDVVASAASGKWLDLLIQVAIAAIFIFAAFTGWRHVGTIDPRVWRSYLWVFPLLALVTVLGLSSIHLSTDLFENVEALARLFGLLWIAGIAIPGFICVLLLRRMKIAPMDVPVTKLITQLIQRGGVSAPTVTHVHRPGLRRAIVYGVIGGAILLGTTFVPLPSDINQASTMMKVTQQLNLLAFFLIVRARRHFQVSADSLLAVDKRPPILFLRSFTDDERQHYGNSERALLDFSLETRLANHFQRFGPFIAVGSPKETLPEPGAARVLLSDDEWQSRVLNWIVTSNLIVMYGGTTDWVNWELRKVIESGRSTNLILMIPESKQWRSSRRNQNIAARIAQIRNAFSGTPWNEELTEFSGFTNLRAMLFRADGSMVMIKSQSRSRESYHLAALIAHQQLLDPVPAAESEAADLVVKRKSRRVWATAASISVAAVVIAVYQFTPSRVTRLTFDKGELYYATPVTQAEAMGVGNYLLQKEYFSNDKATSVRLDRDQGRYRLRFVVSPTAADDPLVAIEFGVMGSEVNHNVLRGQPIDVVLSDETLKPIKIVPASAKLTFGKSDLYYTDPVTVEEAQQVGQNLVTREFFSDENEISVHLGRDGDTYQLEFVVDPKHADDPLIVIQFGAIGSEVASQVLGGKPMKVALCDRHMRPVKFLPASARLAFGKGELFYTDPVTSHEARQVGDQLLHLNYFNQDTGSSAHLRHEGGIYQLSFVIKPSFADDANVRAVFHEWTRTVAIQALGSQPVLMHLCDDEFRILRSERVDAEAKK